MTCVGPSSSDAESTSPGVMDGDWKLFQVAAGEELLIGVSNEFDFEP